MTRTDDAPGDEIHPALSKPASGEGAHPPLKALYDLPAVTSELTATLQRVERDTQSLSARAPAHRNAKLEADREAALAAIKVLHGLLEANATTYYAMQRAHEADITALTASRSELNHWREARQFALEAGEILKSERDAALLEVKQLRAAASQAHRSNAGTYIASRTWRAPTWRRLRDNDGWKITSSWIDEARAGESTDLGSLWEHIAAEIGRSERLILYAETEDFPLKGALIEVGMAIAARIPIRVVIPDVILDPVSFRPLGSWVRHPMVIFCDTMDEALEGASINM